MGILSFLLPAKSEKEIGETIVIFKGGAYWLERGPVRKEITITAEFLEKNKMTFDEALRRHRLRDDYVPGAWDASVPPRRIRVGEPFCYTDYSKPDEFVWKFYKRADDVLRLMFETNKSKAEAVTAARDFIKKDT